MAPRSCREGTRMLKLAAALLSFLALAAAALAEPASLSFGGGRLVEKYASRGPQAAIIEFVPPDQTLDSWTSLVGFRGLWESKGTAADAAAALALVTGERYPASKPASSPKARRRWSSSSPRRRTRPRGIQRLQIRASARLPRDRVV